MGAVVTPSGMPRRGSKNINVYATHASDVTVAMFASGQAESRIRPPYSATRARRYKGSMIWFYERQQARLHYEIRRQSDGPGYELAITHPDGRQVVERYGSAADLIERAMVLQNTLIADGWQPPAVGSRAPYRSTEC